MRQTTTLLFVFFALGALGAVLYLVDHRSHGLPGAAPSAAVADHPEQVRLRPFGDLPGSK